MDRTSNTAPRDQLIRECRQLAMKLVEENFRLYQEYLVEQLFKMADKANSNTEQTRLFEARKQIQTHHKAIAINFSEHLKSAFGDYSKCQPTVSRDFIEEISDNDSLSLVDNDKLEESIALNSMSRKAESRSAEELYALNKRLSAIRGGTKLASHDSPIEPTVFAEGIRQAISPLSFDTKTKLTAYKIFDTQFMAWLEQYYCQLNEQLIKRGILVNLRYDAKRDDDDKRQSKQSQQSAKQQEKPEQASRETPSGRTRPPNVPGHAGTIDDAPLRGVFQPQPGSTGSGTANTATQGKGAYRAASPSGRAASRNFDEQPSPEQEAALMERLEQSFAVQRDLLSAILSLQESRRSDSAEPGYAGNYTTAPYSPQQLIDHLGYMQVDQASVLEDNDAPLSILTDTVEVLKERLARETEEHKDVSRLDADLIEIVGLLFDQMLNSEDLPDAAKALLSYLHTPFLKLALQDREFFEHPQHPARQLLNSLVDAGEHWLEGGDLKRNTVFSEMRAVVHRVLNEFDDDVTLFSELAFEFTGFMKQHKRRVKITEERAKQAAKGEDKLKEIRITVTRTLDEHTSGKRLPQPIIELLYEPWANYMSFNYLRFGENSAEWESAIKVVKEILWFIEPKQSWVGKKAASEMSHSLVSLLEQGFKTVGYDNEKSATLMKSLQLCQRLSVDGIKDPSLLPEVFQPESERPQEPLPKEAQAFMERLPQIKVGTWFAFSGDFPALDGNGQDNAKDKEERKLAKLSWANTKTQNYMFVNKLGHQFAAFTARELAEGLANGTVQELDKDFSKPFIERALSGILDQMKRR